MPLTELQMPLTKLQMPGTISYSEESIRTHRAN